MTVGVGRMAGTAVDHADIARALGRAGPLATSGADRVPTGAGRFDPAEVPAQPTIDAVASFEEAWDLLVGARAVSRPSVEAGWTTAIAASLAVLECEIRAPGSHPPRADSGTVWSWEQGGSERRWGMRLPGFMMPAGSATLQGPAGLHAARRGVVVQVGDHSRPDPWWWAIPPPLHPAVASMVQCQHSVALLHVGHLGEDRERSTG